MKKQKINKDMPIAQVMNEYPETVEIMQKHLGFCASCPSASMETIEAGAKLHDRKAEDIVKELNELIAKKSK